MKNPLILRNLHQTVIIALSAVFLAFPAIAADALPQSKLVMGGKTFSVETATTREQQQRGLMFRTELAADAGMLFVMPRTQSTAMWMKNTFIPLDMIFIADDGSIVNIAEDTQPESLAAIRSAAPVKAVLEVPAGTANKLRLKAGDKVAHEVFTRARR